MTLGEQIKTMRKQAGMSQEKLAEKLGVSRQAITKWENNGGVPEVENLLALSTLFNVSVDSLLSVDKNEKLQSDYLYESVTEYDIDQVKRYDMKFGGADTVSLIGYDGEKIRIRLASNKLSSIQNDFKVKIDDVKGVIDVDINRFNKMTEAAAKDSLTIFAYIPQKYISRIELETNAKNLEFHTLNCENIELDGKVINLLIDDIEATLELNCNLDMNINCSSLKGNVEINQISATSKITVPKDSNFTTVKKGIGNNISYEVEGKQVEYFGSSESENVIELNGIKSELIITMEV